MQHDGNICERADRRGVTLVESLVVISLISIVLAGVGPAMAALVRVRHDVNQDLILQKSIERISTDFRGDVRRAQSCHAGDRNGEVWALELNTATETIHYAIRGDHIRRMLMPNENGKQAIEDYLLFPGATGEFEIATDQKSVALKLTIPWSSRGRGTRNRSLTLTGRISGDLPHFRNNHS